MDAKSLGQMLRRHRTRRGQTIMECAEQIGISTRYLADIERGDKVPKLETFVRILNVLGASADEVLQDSLEVGYQAKSNDLLKRLEALDSARRRQALQILDGVITSLQSENN